MLDASIPGATGSRVVHRHRIRLTGAKWLHQPLRLETLLGHQVVDHRVRTPLAQRAIVQSIASCVSETNDLGHPALGVLAFHPFSRLIDCGLGRLM